MPIVRARFRGRSDLDCTMAKSDPHQPLGQFAHLLPRGWSSIVTLWFQEDAPSMDYGGFVVGETDETATLFGKSRVGPL